MTRIITYAHRYKRPPKKRKAAALKVSRIVRKRASNPAADAPEPSPPAASDDRKSAIVTIKRKSRFGDAPDMTPEEHQRRGDAADALFRELVRLASAR